MFNADSDATYLRDILTSKPRKIAELIKLAVERTNEQRQLGRQAYNTKFQRNLIVDLKKELSGNLQTTLVSLYRTPAEYDAHQLRNAVKGIGTNEDTLIEILATRTPALINEIKQVYPVEYPGRDVIVDIKDDCSGVFLKMLMALLDGDRPNNPNPDPKECEENARLLFDVGEKKKSNNEEVFINMFTKRSPEEFVAITQAYFRLTGHTILEAVEKEFSGDCLRCLKAIIYAMLSPSEFFANKINKAITGLGTDDNMLIRIIVSRSEIDLHRIKKYYQQIYKKDLAEAVKGETSGDYRTLLLEILNRP